MNGSIKDYMKVGIVHFMAFPETGKGTGPIYETVKRFVTDDYFDAIEITWIKDAQERTKTKEMLQGAHMAVYYGSQPRLLTQGLDINSEDESMRRRAIDEVKSAIDDAHDLGLGGVALLSGKDGGPDKREQLMNLLTSSLTELCGYAAERKMSVVLEVFDKTVDKKCLIGYAADAKDIAERVKKTHPNFGLMVDLSHIPLTYESPEQALLPVKEHLVHIHIGNAYMSEQSDPAYGDMHPRFGYPGSANDVPELMAFLKVLLQMGYLQQGNPKTVSFEIKPVPGEDPEVVIANAKRTLNEAWARLSL
ncbi:MAG: Sugar phosphate isomerase/epimerase [Bacilli bacterium]|nr:Sugar phosphate isomerase/epimerase [Bacilli bacterium]